ncbi:lipocalin family protein [uncultured Bacteroides sp.]|uniref:lipocalin family protein n=1 Tax=uncultured Bacteroides sp. TaxID=162156 RepID=UPI0025E6260A|nr:lipocalin family protein [uncultured Bacteroides sp.]
MRTFRILAALMMAVVCVSLSSCSDDDKNDKPVIEEANLIGKWQSTWEKVHTVENGKEVVISDEAYTDGSWEFKADGTCIENGNTTSAHWTLKHDKLTISYNEGFDDDYTVKELTANKLVLVFEDWDNTDDGGEVLDDATTTTYKKID